MRKQAKKSEMKIESFDFGTDLEKCLYAIDKSW